VLPLHSGEPFVIVDTLIDRSLITLTATTILIGAGSYEVDNGSAPETFYWDSQLTFVLGSGGSNASSSAIGTSQWQYIYMDESAISASPLVAASFLNSTTAPTYSQLNMGGITVVIVACLQFI
jgi:hypothetical protein